MASKKRKPEEVGAEPPDMIRGQGPVSGKSGRTSHTRPAMAPDRPHAGGAKEKKTARKSTGKRKAALSDQNCLVVGVGASAGGLDAFKQFLRGIADDPGVAFVLISHLDPHYTSKMAELLSKYTAMPVVQAEESCRVRPNRVYVIPPNKYIRMRRGGLFLDDPVEDRWRRMPIDCFFRSLAEERGERAACIVLSGNGSDGSQGVREVKGAGGLTIAQQPETAQYEGMPRSAVATGMTDFILPIGEMAEVLVRYARHPYVRGEKMTTRLDQSSPDHFKSILSVLHAHTRYDFRNYKKGTLERRIQRRMGLRHIDQIPAYLGLLRNEPDEVQALFKDLLIGVTRFFRDTEAWKKLEAEVIRPVIAAKNSGETLRFWVPGCSTGEEAYSIAILIHEELERQNKVLDVRVFATDLDEASIKTARTGSYPPNIGPDLGEERLRRFFAQGGEWFRADKRLRECCEFAVQNLISDPPFSGLDLISCRNLLIYLEPEIQRKLTRLFHSALRPDGYLFLGTSESVTRGARYFFPVAKDARIYRRKGGASTGDSRLPIAASPPTREQKRLEPGGEPGLSESSQVVEFARKSLLDRFAPPSVLIDSAGQVLYFHGRLGGYLDVPSGTPTRDLESLLGKGLGDKVRSLVQRAAREDERVESVARGVQRGQGRVSVRITVDPVDFGPDRRWMLVSFQDEEPVPTPPEAGHTGGDARSAVADPDLRQQLEDQLQATREDLQNMIEELEGSHEALKASSEEVMSMNEEFQSTNEELETAREELPSLNEELGTVNNRLEEKVDELESLSNDLFNLLNSTGIATIFLDTEFRIRRFTPASTELFHIIPSDEGRPLSDLATRVNDPDLLDDARGVLDKLVLIEREVRDGDGRTFMRRIQPYRTQENKIEGVVVTFTSVGMPREAFHAMIEETAAERTVRAIPRRLAAIVENSHDPIIGQDLDGVIVSWNAAAERVSGYPAQEAVGRRIEMLMPEDRHEELGRILDQVRRGEPVPDLETVCRHKDGRRLDVQFTVSPISDREGRVVGASTIIHDLSERKRTELALLQSEEQLKMAQEAAGIGIYDWNIPGDSIRWDARVREFWGASGDEPIGYETFLEGLHPDDRGPAEAAIKRALDPQGSGILSVEYRVIHRLRGSTCWLAATGKVSFEDQRPVRLVGMVQDITQRREAELRLEEVADRLEEQVAERTAVAEGKAEDLRLLACQITNAEQRARRKLAQLIHDDLQQLLAAAKMRLPDSGQMASPEELESIAEILDQALKKSRTLVSELSPPILREGSFTDALGWLARWMEEHHRLKVETRFVGNLEDIGDSLRTLLFCCARELLFNAAKHAGTTQARMNVAREEDDLHVEIEDHGKGFDPGKIQRRSDSFGLFNTQERIEAFGGRMKIESAPGEGARFRITVPLMALNGESSESRDTRRWSDHQARRLMPAGGVVRVLLADDHKMVREGIARILSADSRIEVIGEASDGQEAIEQARRLQPNAILMDISMPRLNGIEATQKICEEMPEAVVIGLSLHDRAGLGEAIIEAGAADFLKKDVPAGTLIETILGWFEETSAAGPESGPAAD